VQIPGQMRQYNIEIFSNDYELLTKHKFQQNKTFVMARKAV
jgi:translation initiation factor IF-1